MQRESVSLGQAFSLIALFIMGSTITLGTGNQAENDAWLSIVIGLLEALPLILIMIKLLNRFHNKNLFEIMEIVLGKVLGKGVILLYTWYALHLGSLVIRNFGEFVNTVSLPETPMFVILLLMGLFSIWIVHSGVEVMARSAKLMMYAVMFVLIAINLLAIPQFNLDYLSPFLGHGLKPVLNGAFSAFSFPFAETILLSVVIISLDHPKALKRAYLGGYFIAGITILILSIRNIVMIGPTFGQLPHFPAFAAVSRIKIGDFIQRIEGAVFIAFQTCAFFKISICHYAFTQGIAKLFNHNNYRSYVLPSGLIMICLSQIVYDNIMDMRDFAFMIYPYYALPFQVLFPLLLFIVYLIRERMGNLPALKAESKQTKTSIK